MSILHLVCILLNITYSSTSALKFSGKTGFSSRGKSPTHFQNQDQLKIVLSIATILFSLILTIARVFKKEKKIQLFKGKNLSFPSSALSYFSSPLTLWKIFFLQFFKTPLENQGSTSFSPLQGSHLHCSAWETLFTPFFPFLSPMLLYFWYHVTKAWGMWFILFCKQILCSCSGNYKFSKPWNTFLIWKTLHSDDKLILWVFTSCSYCSFLPQTNSATVTGQNWV